jgi:hypothetical protein
MLIVRVFLSLSLKGASDGPVPFHRALWLVKVCPRSHTIGFRACLEAAFADLAGSPLGTLPSALAAQLVRALAAGVSDEVHLLQIVALCLGSAGPFSKPH